MPFTRIWLHLVWSTKNRIPFLNDNIRPAVFDHIYQNAKLKDLGIDCIDGHVEHAHCTLALGHNQTISKVIQLIKGESSYWINKNKLCNGKFEWQDEYFAESVSPKDLDNVRAYIRGQSEHHRKKTFNEEYEEMIASFKRDNLLPP